MMAKKSIIYIVVLSGVLMLAQSCSTSKKCGCGTDINRMHQPKRFH
jgi:hypothetical protein